MDQERALDGLRVIDLTRVLAGPLSTMWLGDMGADVIKVEQPGKGDDTRAWGPPFVGTESAYFLGVNRNKRSITIDLASEGGQGLLQTLIADADVVVDNFKIGTLERWGFTDQWYEDNAPRVVRCTVSGYGSSGPKAGMPGYDFILQAETGLMSITGQPDGEAMKYGVAIVDICTGMLATISILGALQSRERTGVGQRTEVSLHDSGIQMLANVAANQLASGQDAGRFGNGHPNIVPYRTYATADGELAVSVGNDAQFQRFAELLGHPQWGSDPRFVRNQDRVANRDTIDGLVADVLITGTRQHWIDMFEPVGIPCGPINTVTEALTSPQTMARNMVTTAGTATDSTATDGIATDGIASSDPGDEPATDPITMVGIPFQMFGTPPSIRLAPPRLGQHTAAVLEEIGLDEGRIDELEAQGVITRGAEQ